MDHSVLQERSDEPLSEFSPELAAGHAASELDLARRAVAARAIIKSVAFDHLSDVRYLHAQSIKHLATGEFTDEELAAAKTVVYSPKYVDGLGAAIGRKQFFGAWIGETLVGTCGWSAMDDATPTARIRSIFVSPLYARMGLAQKLLTHTEQHATAAGFRTYSVRSMANATGFFLRQGYVVTSHGVRTILPGRSVPVTFWRKTAA
jgi:GNAT superfamily N-acetyltransferase